MQTRELTEAEKLLISLIVNNLRSAKPSEVFIDDLNKQLRNGTGKNPKEKKERIYVNEKDFYDVLKARLDGKEISTQMIFVICKALCQQKTFGDTLDNAPIRTEHVFNFLYEELVRRHKFYVNNGEVPDKIPDDINAIHYELLQYFRKAAPGNSEQTMCNCLLVKIAPGELLNVASEEQKDKLLGGIRGLQAAPQVSQAYFDRVDKDMKKKDPLVKQMQENYKSANPEAAKPRRSLSTFFAKKPKEPTQVRSASEPTPGKKPGGKPGPG